MTTDTPNRKTTISKQQVDLKIRQPDMKSAAAELTRRIDDVKKSIAGIEQAKAVSQELLRKEVSI
jgi:hypothetical protein